MMWGIGITLIKLHFAVRHTYPINQKQVLILLRPAFAREPWWVLKTSAYFLSSLPVHLFCCIVGYPLICCHQQWVWTSTYIQFISRYIHIALLRPYKSQNFQNPFLVWASISFCISFQISSIIWSAWINGIQVRDDLHSELQLYLFLQVQFT